MPREAAGSWLPVGPAHLFAGLEGLRGVAAGLVFMVHFSELANRWILGQAGVAVFGALGLLGNVGVDLFFGLSGFLIYDSLMRRPQPVLPYLRRRAMRIYPAFLTVLATYLVIGVAVPEFSRVPAGTGAAIGYVTANLALLPGVFPIVPIVTVAWSLSYELAFYALLPLLVWGLRLRAWPVAARTGLILLVPLALQLAGSHHARAGLFACGMLVAESRWLLVARGRWLGAAALLGMLASATLLLRGGGAPLESFAAFWTVFATVYALCGTAIAGRGPVAAVLGWRPLRWLGTISYSFYLVHGAVLHAFFASVAFVGLKGDLALPLLLPAFAASVAASIVLYRVVERRFSPEPVRPAARPGSSSRHSPSPCPLPASP